MGGKNYLQEIFFNTEPKKHENNITKQPKKQSLAQTKITQWKSQKDRPMIQKNHIHRIKFCCELHLFVYELRVIGIQIKTVKFPAS